MVVTGAGVGAAGAGVDDDEASVVAGLLDFAGSAAFGAGLA